MGLFGDTLGGIGSFVGDLAGQGDRENAAADYEKARQEYEKLHPEITAQTEQTFSQGPSAYLSADPATRAAQMDALSNLTGQYKAGGLDAVSRANLADIQNQNAQAARTVQARVADQASRQGLGNSALSLVQQQVAGQNAAQQGSQNALQVAAQAEAARRAALSGAAGLAGQIRAGDYDRAAAQDAISRFNTQNSQGVADRNVNRNLTAQQYSYGNALNRAGGIAGGYGGQAGQANSQADATRRRWAGLGQGIGSGIDGIGPTSGRGGGAAGSGGSVFDSDLGAEMAGAAI